jgi:hypothetical protein
MVSVEQTLFAGILRNYNWAIKVITAWIPVAEAKTGQAIRRPKLLARSDLCFREGEMGSISPIGRTQVLGKQAVEHVHSGAVSPFFVKMSPQPSQGLLEQWILCDGFLGAHLMLPNAANESRTAATGSDIASRASAPFACSRRRFCLRRFNTVSMHKKIAISPQQSTEQPCYERYDSDNLGRARKVPRRFTVLGSARVQDVLLVRTIECDKLSDRSKEHHEAP